MKSAINIAKSLLENELKEYIIMPYESDKVIMILNKKNGKVFAYHSSIPIGGEDHGWKFGIRKSMINNIKNELK